MAKINVTIFADELEIFGYDKDGVPFTKYAGHTQFVIEVEQSIVDDTFLFDETIKDLLGNESDDNIVYRYFNHSHGLFPPKNLTKEFNDVYKKVVSEIVIYEIETPE